LRIRSQSWRNELIEKHIRQKGPATPGFFLFAAMDFAGLLHATFLRPVFLPAQFCADARERAGATASSDSNVDAGC
jgi:hypothetical protein